MKKIKKAEKKETALSKALKSPEWADVLERAHREPHCVEVSMTKSTAIKLTFVVPYKGAVVLLDALVNARKERGK